MKISKLCNKFKRVCKDEGLAAAVGRVFHYAGNVEGRSLRKIDVERAQNHKGTVLFINGCCVEHPTRYRVLHQMEQLREAGISCEKVLFEDIELQMEQNFQLFIFYRCECTDEVAKFIDLAKSHGKTVCFDVDDLITDTKYTDQVPFVQEMQPLNRRLFDEIIRRTGVTLSKSDIAITTTEELAHELGKVIPRTYINRNTASKEMVLCAERAYQNASRDASRIVLGYFSGSLTHNQDFEIVRPALMRLMEKYPQVWLLLVGELDASDELQKFRDRIVRKKTTDWRELPKLIVQADINLAPLEDTIFNRSKSEIKWIEAALVRVPTVASKLGAFEVMVKDGVTGVLCENEDDAWYQRLARLVEQEAQRKMIAQQAYSYVMQHCTTIAKAKEYSVFIETLL